jgi:hypothetical protein
MKIMKLGKIIICILVCAVCAAAQSNRSVYSNLGAKSCRTLKSDDSEGNSYVGICGGVGGYKLQVEEGDLRQNIQVITPAGQKHSLELWIVVASGFSSLGDKAEWRVRTQRGKVVPIALIFRYDTNNPDGFAEKKSYLVVAKITPTKICVTHKIEPGAGANVTARAAADESADKPCLSNP